MLTHILYTVQYMPSKSRESFPGKHLPSTSGQWRTELWQCQFESPSVPCAASPWDYLGFTGHAKASQKLSVSRNVDYHLNLCIEMHSVLRCLPYKETFSIGIIQSLCHNMFSQLSGYRQLMSISWEWRFLPSLAFISPMLLQFIIQKQQFAQNMLKIFGRKWVPFGIILSGIIWIQMRLLVRFILAAWTKVVENVLKNQFI